MTKLLLPGATIGIIGAGQLGKMLAQSAQKMGYRVAMYDPNPTSCGFAVANDYTIASFSDEEQLLQFVQSVDVVTYEFENIDAVLLKKVANLGYLPQGTDLLLSSQNRLDEKQWLASIGVETVSFKEIIDWESLNNAENGLLKTSRFGYDGKGQYLIEKKEDLLRNKQAIKAILTEQNLIFEAICRFEYEASVIVARDVLGNIQVFPPSINQHIHGVLFSSSVGEELSPEVEQEMTKIATKIAEAGNLVGVCGVEFFVTKGQQVLVNEIAPRPHNSGHYTIEACNISQFDQHILAITGRPLVPIKLNDSALMINILGQHMGQLEETIQQYPEALLHVYGKDEAKDQRKMGHFTVLVEDAHALLESQFLQSWRQTF